MLSFQELLSTSAVHDPAELTDALAEWQNKEVVLRGFVAEGERGEKILSPHPEVIRLHEHVVLTNWPGTSPKDRPIDVRGRFSVSVQEIDGEVVHCFRLDDCRVQVSPMGAASAFLLVPVLAVAVVYYVRHLGQRFSQKSGSQ